MAQKFRETETHVYFVAGPLSQWHRAAFTAPCRKDGRSWTFNCAEQYMMACKAELFGDTATRDAILAVGAPSGGEFHLAPQKQKALGRQVRNFDPLLWDRSARDIVFRGNWFKFTQNDNLKKYLLNTGDRQLVEGAQYDPIWGVGLNWNDKRIEDVSQWQGKNWLGEVLMRVRQALAAPEDAARFDIWGTVLSG